MSINHRWKRLETDLCPMCTSALETIHHLLSCTHKDIEYVCTLAIGKFIDTLNTLNTQPDMVLHWKLLFKCVTLQSDFPPPKILMSNPSSWSLRQAHQQQSSIGWTNFFKGMIGTKWADIQWCHYKNTNNDGENIHRWKRMVVMTFFDLHKDLWRTRCGYIYAEKTMTEKNMLVQRTYRLHENNKHKRELISVLDRHVKKPWSCGNRSLKKHYTV